MGEGVKFWEAKGMREGRGTTERAGQEERETAGTDRGNSLQFVEKGRRSWEREQSGGWARVGRRRWGHPELRK